MILTQKYPFINAIRSALESIYLVPIMFLIGSICWWFSLSLVSVAVFAGVAVLIFLFCKNVNNFFALLFYVSFFIKNIYVGNTNWIGYIVSIAIAVVFIFAFAIKMIIVEKISLKDSKMAIAIILSSVAFLLGGVIGRFDILVFAITLGLSLATFVIYLIARHRTCELTKYFAKLFMIGGVFLIINILAHRLSLTGSIFIGKPQGELFFFSSQTLNTAAIYIMLAIGGCYFFGAGKKWDVLWFLLSVFFYGAVILTSCRAAILVASLVIIAIFVLFIVQSKRRLNFLWLTLALALCLGVVLIVFRGQVGKLIAMIGEKLNSGLNGRDELWPWCIEMFKKYPVFGFGFVADEPVPSLSHNTTVALAHNTPLQWLTSLGIIGTLVMCYFYFVKYKIVFKGASLNKCFLIISILAIELIGMFDQTPSMDIFMYILAVVLIACCERPKKQYKMVKTYKKAVWKTPLHMHK
ncbi:MAG: O-antigen ligase family protein [Clostridiales bacterium]|nr:O-antigen ligase family protein [Clostridiales bacterium]